MLILKLDGIYKSFILSKLNHFDYISNRCYIKILLFQYIVFVMECLQHHDAWQTMERPGYLGKARDEAYRVWNRVFGEGNWRITNEMANGEIFSYEDIIWKVYVPGYVQHFLRNPNEAHYIVDNFVYGYDKDVCTKEQAFDIYALYNKPGVANQFHHVAFNIALEYYLGLKFRGNKILQVREGKPGTSDSEQPDGFRWSPGRITTVRPDLTPELVEFLPDQNIWWKSESIEEQYQLSKVLQVKIR